MQTNDSHAGFGSGRRVIGREPRRRTMSQKIEPTVLATEFSRIIREWFDAKTLAKVNAENKRRNDNTCATHDHFDTNEAMGEAFQKVVGRRSRANSQSDADLWNMGWAIAKQNNFSLGA